MISNFMPVPFIIQISSFTLGITSLFLFTKKRTSYLKKDEALFMISSITLILLGIPDFQSPVAVLLKYTLLGFLGVFIALIIFYLIYTERFNTHQRLESELDSLVSDFFQKNKENLSFGGESILVLLPAYNEEENLKNILDLAPKKIKDIPVVLLVIDDGSVDHTARVAQEHALVLSLPENRGGGCALFTGFLVAKKINVPYIVTMDADGQHQFSDLENLITPILEGKVEVVLGSRFTTNSLYANKFRSAGIFLFNFILRIILGHKVSDCSNSYRAFTLNALKQLDLREQKHHTAEFVIRVAKKKIDVLEASVNVQNRLFGKSKKGNSILYALRFSRTILTSWWRV